MDSSSEDFEDSNYVEDGDFDDLDDITDSPKKKPHFLDYDAAPPAEDISFTCYPSLPSGSSGQNFNSENDLDKNNASEKLINNGNENGPPSSMNSIDWQRTNYCIDAANPNKDCNNDRFSAVSGSSSATARRNSAGGDEVVTTTNTGTKKKEHFHTSRQQQPTSSKGGGRFRSLDHDQEYSSRGNRTYNKMSLDRNQYQPQGRECQGMSTSLSYLEPEASSQNRGTWPDSSSKRESKKMSELGPKVECVYSLLSMLGSCDIKVTSSKFLELSKSPETCYTLRRSGCIPLFVQMIHSDSDEVSRKNAAQALHNVVHCHPDDKAGRRESKVLKLIETIMEYCEFLRRILIDKTLADDRERHPSQAICSLMKVSFDEEHRHAMCQLGALQAIANLVHLDHAVHGLKPVDSRCISLRRYAGMALTNLTFGDGNNKALLCSNKDFMKALVAQLDSEADDLIQVTASVLRNLSWRADNAMITVLNEIGTVTALARAAMRNNMENTLKAILSALWNLSAHCSSNKAEFCRVEGALAFLVEMLTFDAPSKTLTIIENAGGILRNVSSHIAVREDYRQILRERDCLGILLQQLRSESLTVVSNACGTLWNLSARCPKDQKYLWDNGAVPMLRSLIHSKHKMISNGSNAALKNLLNYRPGNLNQMSVDSITKSMNLKELPSLSIRKQRALEQELGRNLSDTCEIIDMTTSPKADKKVNSKKVVQKSESEESSKGQSINKKTTEVQSKYQETDLDQITDYSIRYAENQIEQEKITDNGSYNGNEILLILEDSVKCYETEGTPYAISNATSMTDLRINKEVIKKGELRTHQKQIAAMSIQSSGVQTPEKPVNYCEEGTPGYFSREFSRQGSLSSLEEGLESEEVQKIEEKVSEEVVKSDKKQDIEQEQVTKPVQTPTGASQKAVSFIEYEQETPLMFSRTSSVESLASAEPGCIDDASSVISEFSRVASGVMSPSELPDSPTQSVPQSPGRKVIRSDEKEPEGVSKNQSVFEDNVNRFNVENTPAQFSCATSLSNLSILNDDKEMVKENKDKLDVLASLDESEKEEEEDDAEILATCISMGMNSGVKNNPRPEEKPQINSDAVKQYFTEDTPAYLSKAGSNSDLSVLSMLDTNQCEIVASDDSTNGSDPDNDQLLQECIRNGMQKSTSVIKIMPKESNVPEIPGPSNLKTGNDSLSSLSVDSDEDNDILNQAIAAGMNSKIKTGKMVLQTNSSQFPVQNPIVAKSRNDSLSSIDSGDSNDQTNLLLEQCIQLGMNKKANSNVKPQKSKPSTTTTTTTSGNSVKKTVSPKKLAKMANESHRDEQLLMECIKMGMEKGVKKVAQSAIPRPKERENINPELALTKKMERMNLDENRVFEERLNSKNGNGASVAVSSGTVNVQSLSFPGSSTPTYSSSKSKDGRIIDRIVEGTDAPKGDLIPSPHHNHSNHFNSSSISKSAQSSATINSINGFDVLEQSNEYPALKISNLTMDDSVDKDSSNIMMTSNEYLIENVLSTSAGPMDNKHKDPDLMLKSVDRLTHVLVTTAEYLRSHPNEDSMIQSDIKKTLSTSTSTWNENTCPNGDVSFPSLSYSAPKIEDDHSLSLKSNHIIDNDDDDTLNASLSLNNNRCSEPASTPLQQVQSTVDASFDRPNQVPTIGQVDEKQETARIVVETMATEDRPDGIDFQIGGQVNVALESLESATMLSHLKKYNITESVTSLDLDNIQPPSEMEGISYMARNDSPQMSSLKNRKLVTSAMIAKRAIAGGNPSLFARSVESINSSTNLESVAPPSIMDELLDSMMSVDSITSEIVSANNGINFHITGAETTTHYETALSDNEDTLTLRSCRDLPIDSSSNCSSNQSTPAKRNRSMTPKLKRQMVKDRFKTYTIERTSAEGDSTDQEERNPIEIVVVEKSSPKQRRQENRSRFQTQVLEVSQLRNMDIQPPEASEVVLEVGNHIEASEPPSEEVQNEEPKLETGTKPTIRSKLMKLIKPEPAESEAKPIRGKKKPEYISPYRRPSPSATSTTPSSQRIAAKANSANKIPQSKSSSATTPKVTGVLRKSTFITRIGLGSKKATPQKPEEVQSPSPDPTKMLNRQGTFTKDEPSSDKIPVVTSLPATPKKQISKVPLRNGVPKSGPSTPITPPTQGPFSTKKSGIMKRQISAPGNSADKRKSLGNATPKTTVSNGSLSQRSSSNASIKSSNTSAVQSPLRPDKKFPFSMPTTRSNSTAAKSPRLEIPKLSNFGLRNKLMSPAASAK